jgi:predicted enzyme related to lactoylglutathione lyase
MIDPNGRFVWYELTTTDANAATRFYSYVVGWNAEVMPMEGFDYTVLKMGDKQVAGLFVLPSEEPGARMPPMWIGYVAVPDVDASAETVKRLGGSVVRAPGDIPNIGRFAIAGDQAGAGFALFKGIPPEGGFEPAPMDQPGFCAWHELIAGDLDREWAFYEGLFGWTKAQAMEMPGAGLYQMFQADGRMIGGMMTRPADVPMSLWGFYFMVPDIDAAVERIDGAGGKVIMPPMLVPGDLWAMKGIDPQGAIFSLVGPGKARNPRAL